MAVDHLNPLLRVKACVLAHRPGDWEALRLVDTMLMRERSLVFEADWIGGFYLGTLSAYHRWTPQRTEVVTAIARAVAQPFRPIDVSAVQDYHHQAHKRIELIRRRLDRALQAVERHSVPLFTCLARDGMLVVETSNVGRNERLWLTWNGQAFFTTGECGIRVGDDALLTTPAVQRIAAPQPRANDQDTV